jgi:hypothetical protein
MTIVPFPAPPGFKWIFTTEYLDTLTDRIIRASATGRHSFCLLVHVGSTS